MSQNSIFPNKIQLSFPVPNWPYPNWPYHFFQKFSSAQQNQLSPLIENLISPFLKHLSLEFGVFHRKNPKLALQKYQEAAEINDSMSNLRLFYIYSQENKKFHLAHNQDLAILHLIQASAFWNPTLRIGIANPKILLAKILDSEDNQLYKARLVINKYVKGVERKSFLTNWLMNTFPIEKELAEFHLEEIINQAENGKEPEACFYYGEILREESKIQKEKTHKARDMLEIARKANLSKSFFGLSKILEELGENDEAINLLKKGGKMGCTNCLHYLANKLALEGKNQKKALKYAFQAFLLGDLTAGHTFCDIGKSIINNNNDQKPIIGKQIKEISESLISMDYESCKEMFQVGANIYLLAQCYLKGL